MTTTVSIFGEPPPADYAMTLHDAMHDSRLAIVPWSLRPQ